MSRYSQGSLKNARKGRAAFPNTVPSGDGARNSARLFHFPVSMTEAWSHARISCVGLPLSSLTYGGSGIRKDPAASLYAVRDPHPYTWVSSQKHARRLYAAF